MNRFPYELPLWWERTLPQLSRALQSPEFNPLLLLRWSIQSQLVSLLIFAADFLLGMALLHPLEKRWSLRMPSPLRFALRLALGNGVGGLLVFGLGLVHLLTPAWMTGVVVLSALAAAVYLWREKALHAPRYRRPSWLAIGLLMLFLPAVVMLQMDLLLPVIEGDSMLYHLSAGRWYAEHHALTYHPGIRFNAQPQHTVLLYLRHWLLTSEETNLKLLNWEYLAILVGTLMGGARLLAAGRLVPVGLLLVAASPVFCWIARVEMADLGLATYLTLGLVLLLRALRQPHWIWCALAGLMLGFAGASKLQGMVTVAGFVVAWLLVAGVSRYWPWRLLWGAAMAIGAGIAVPGIGWWIRSLYHTGSPAYPFFTGSSESKALFAASVRYGFGHDALALLLLPWRMITESSFAFADSYIFGFPFLLLILFGLAAVLRVRGHVSPGVVFLVGGLLLYFSFWFMTGQVMRYLVSLLPVMALLFLSALVALGARRTRWWAIVPLLPVALLATLTPSRVLLHGVPPPVTQQQLDVVHVTALPFFRVVRALNWQSHPKERVYLWFCEDMRFHVRSMSYGDWFGEYNFFWLGRGTTKIQQMLDRLRNAGFRYIVVDQDRTRRGGSIYENDFLQSGFVREEGPTGDAQLILREGRIRVFKLD
ncbi:MAG: hypothetical protein K2X03_18135 [Bryobacteraceae bacterium]|nr:hypothetical protein [Bryobacteraceae bacterium]